MGATVSSSSCSPQLMKMPGRRRGKKAQGSPLGRVLRNFAGSGEDSDGMDWEPTADAGSAEQMPLRRDDAAAAPAAFGSRRLLRHRSPDAYIELTPDMVIVVLGFLSSARRTRRFPPICRQHRTRRENREVWIQLCAEAPWHRAASVDDVSRIMRAHEDVAGVQRRCLETLAERLHCERARKAALEARVTAQVVAALWAFLPAAELQVVALHCVVFLARPIGGAEGMVFHRGMASQGLDAFLGKRGGIAAVLASMRAHGSVDSVQAMGCWSLVNLALNHQQKLELLKLRGLDRVLDAMESHPRVLEVQFRALFALINLRAARHHKDADVQRSAVSTLRRLGIVLHLRRDGDDDAAELVAADAAG
ncbi:hypothetical protein JL720_2155 [Aureococcus anophagefferens]|nr:hypothetical protein JL720_2155 [Aureococcus anophagefferens]